jgi:exopolysaccharide production protein ExoQ
MLGRDAPTSAVDSFNGRTEIWEGVERYIHRRPVLGYGYGGFWTQRHIADVSAAEKWGVAESHSAYLECLLDLGLVGLGAYVAVLLAGIGRAFALHRASGAPAAAFSGAFLVFCAAHGLLESAFVLSLLPVFLTLAVLIELGFRRPDAWRRREAPTGWQRSKGQPSRAEGLVPGVRAAPGLTQARNRVSVR